MKVETGSVPHQLGPTESSDTLGPPGEKRAQEDPNLRSDYSRSSSSSSSLEPSPSPDRKRRDVTVRPSPVPEAKPLPKLRNPKLNPKSRTEEQEPQEPQEQEEDDRGNRGRSRVKNRILTNDIPGNPNMISLMGFETAKQKEKLKPKGSRLFLNKYDLGS